MRISGAILLGLGSLVALSCERQGEAEEAFTPAARTSPAAERAIEAMAAARCDHEQRCNRVGPTTDYMNRDHCMNVMRADAYEELGGCAAGVDQSDLQECLGEIANADCGGPIDAIERVAACQLDDLCM